jgi:hypothetical protein
MGMFAAVLWALGWAVVKVMKLLRVWHLFVLAVAVRMHGKDYAERLFWQAVAERAGSHRLEADNIIRVVNQHAPEGPSDL